MNSDLHMIGNAKATATPTERRAADRRQIAVPGRIIWRDNRGTPRFSSIVTRNVSEFGAYVECLSGPPIPRHRLVSMQLDRTMGADSLPSALKQGKVLCAVYRVGPVSRVTGLPDGYALRLLVEPAQVSTAFAPSLKPAAPLAMPA